MLKHASVVVPIDGVVTPKRVFGWVAYNIKLAAGKTYRVFSEQEIPRSESGNIVFWTKGILSLFHIETATQLRERKAGDLNTEFGNPVQGTVELTALEDTEWWCFQHDVNKYLVPTVQKVILPANSTLSLPLNTKLFLCEGSAKLNGVDIVGPKAINVNKAQATLESTTDIYGLYFT